MISAVKHLAKDMYLSLVIEGVETAEQLEILSSLGVHDIQGFLFSPPRPLAEIEEMTTGPIGQRLQQAA